VENDRFDALTRLLATASSRRRRPAGDAGVLLWSGQVVLLHRLLPERLALLR